MHCGADRNAAATCAQGASGNRSHASEHAKPGTTSSASSEPGACTIASLPSARWTMQQLFDGGETIPSVTVTGSTASFYLPSASVSVQIMDSRREVSPLAEWTPEQIAAGRRWVATWQRAGDELERIHRRELRELDVYRAIELLSGLTGIDPSTHLRTGSGLVEQQRWFMRASGHR
jgi:hypothetical protein